MTTPSHNIMAEFWPKFRMLLVFQIKLYVDAARDLLFSPLAIIAFIVDLIRGNSDEESVFQRVLKLGCDTERAINLFNQHDNEEDGANDLDWLLSQVEDSVRKRYEERKRR